MICPDTCLYFFKPRPHDTKALAPLIVTCSVGFKMIPVFSDTLIVKDGSTRYRYPLIIPIVSASLNLFAEYILYLLFENTHPIHDP